MTEAPLALALERRAGWPVAELAYWRKQAGLETTLPGEARGPFLTQLRGDWARAADEWAEAGCPYEAAGALADSDQEGQLRAARSPSSTVSARDRLPRSSHADCASAAPTFPVVHGRRRDTTRHS